MLLSLVLLTLPVAGCGKKTYPVEGKVILKGETAPSKDLRGYTISLESVGIQPPVSATGEVRADGTFRLSTFKEDDGAVPGKHRVAISFLDEDRGPRPKRHIAPRYARFETSGLEVEIKPQNNQVTLELEPVAK